MEQTAAPFEAPLLFTRKDAVRGEWIMGVLLPNVATKDNHPYA
jgi:hypothetical protein